jgi:hypothetical protein
MSPRILMWHGISPGMAARFERELRFLRRNFDVVPLGKLVSALAEEPGATATGCPGDRYFLAAPTRTSGSQVTRSGKIAKRTMHSTIMKKNGIEASAT